MFYHHYKAPVLFIGIHHFLVFQIGGDAVFADANALDAVLIVESQPRGAFP
jgi:hypothetical protein